MAMEYLDGYRVSDETYQTVLDLLGSEKAMIELVLVMGHYIGLATQLNILRVPNPETGSSLKAERWCCVEGSR